MDSLCNSLRTSAETEGSCPPDVNTLHRLDADLSRETQSHGTEYSGFARQERDRVGTGTVSRRGVLFQTLSSSEKEREMETGIRSPRVQSAGGVTPFQNGNSQTDYVSGASTDVGYIRRPPGCVLAHHDASSIAQVPAFLGGEQGISIQSIAFRVNDGATSVHQSGSCSNRVPTHQRDTGTCVPGRFPGVTPSETYPSDADRSCGYHVRASGIPGESREIRVVPRSGIHFPRAALQYSAGCGASNRGESGQDTSLDSINITVDVDVSSRRVQTARISEQSSGRNTSRSSALSSTAGILFRELGSQVSRMGHPSDSDSIGQRLTAVVDTQRKRSQGCLTISAKSCSDDVHRCIVDRLGGSVHEAHCSRSLEPTRISTTHQCVRDEGGSTCPDSAGKASDPQRDCSSIRQLHSGSLPAQSGGDSIENSVRSDTANFQEISRAQSSLDGTARTGQTEYTGRLSVQGEQSSRNGMDAEHFSIQGHIPNMGSPIRGSVRDFAEQAASPFCLSGTRPPSLGGRRSVTGLDGSRNVCISTVQHDRESTSETACSPKVSHDANRSQVASSGLVPSVTGRSHRRAKRATKRLAESADPAEVISLSPQTAHSPPTRVEAVRGGAVSRGFSSEVAACISSSVRESTSKLYQSHWNKFCGWCLVWKIDPIKASIPQIADFLLWLFQELRLSPGTIAGYRSSLANVFRANGRVSVGSDPDLTALMRNFHIQRPRIRRLLPSWDLALVLHRLLAYPYEPMAESEMKYLTRKTLFLLSLASGARRGEVHALSADPSCLRWSRDYSSCTLRTDPSFIAKTQIGNYCPQAISIPALSAVVGRGEPERSLCPVRALRFYVERTRPIRDGRTRLFLPVRAGKRDISAQTISKWLVSTIKAAYVTASQEDVQLHKVRAHDIRALSASWATFSGVPVDEVMSAASWRSHTTFTDFYLRSLTQHAEGLYALGPIVVSQSVSAQRSPRLERETGLV